MRADMDDRARNNHEHIPKRHSVTPRHPRQPLSVFRYRVPVFCSLLPPRCLTGKRYRPRRELHSSVSSVHPLIGSQPHPHDSKPSASRRWLPGSRDPNASFPLRLMCWAAVRVTHPVCCVENPIPCSNVKRMSGALGSPVLRGSNKETKALDVEGTVGSV